MSQLRRRVKELSLQMRQGDAGAAAALLSHSVRMGHEQLAVRRLFLAHAMGAEICEQDARYCLGLISDLSPDTLTQIASDTSRLSRTYIARRAAQAF